MRPLLAPLSALLTLALAGASCPAAVVYVDLRSPGPTRDGKSWQTAYLTVSSGLGIAAPGDEVWVAAGTYNQRVTLKNGVAIYGGFAGTETERSQRDWKRNRTVLDGSNSSTVVTAGSTVTRTAVLDGFIIRNGNAPLSGSVVYGGGMLLSSASPTVRNNTFVRNFAQSGGAIYSLNGSPLIENNRFLGNCAYTGTVYVGQYSTTTLPTPPIIRNNVFLGNAGEGSGIYEGGCSTVITGNTLVGNGGLALQTISSGRPVIVNNIIAFNGAGVYMPSNLTTFVFNHNCVYGNFQVDYQWRPWGDQNAWKATNVAADPGLSSVAGGEVHLLPSSPCIGAGDPAQADAEQLDIDGQPRANSGAVDIGADQADGTVHTWTPRIVRVSPTGNDANDGASWDAPKRRIQAAADEVALAGGEVWVAAGTYLENVAQGPYTSLLGGFAGSEIEKTQRDPAANVTVIDGNRSGSVLRLWSGYAPAAVDGFTLRNGTGTAYNGTSERYGGGIYASVSSPAITNNIIRDCAATFEGGGIYCGGSQAVISGNLITSNSTTSTGVEECGGGGVFAFGQDLVLRNNVITKNSAPNGGGLLLASARIMVVENTITENQATLSGNFGGGGIKVYYSAPDIVRNKIAGNTAAGTGGGILVSHNSFPRIRSNVIAGNKAATGGGVFTAAHSYSSDRTSALMMNDTVVGNTATGEGGGLYITDGSVVNTIVASNSSGLYTTLTSAEVHHNDVYGNVAYDYKGIDDQTGNLGSLKTDPLFVDAGASDYRLNPASPLVDAGTDDGVAPGELDFAGNARRLGLHADMGAYETVPAGTFTIMDLRRALSLAAGLSAGEAGDDRLNVESPETTGVDTGDVVRLARKVAGLAQNP